MDSQSYLLGVDVGTGSVRAAVFDPTGKMLGMSVSPINIFHSQDLYVEQSTENIWEKTCLTVGQAVEKSGVAPERIKGIGFDATCSLVALGADDRPVSVSVSGNASQNVIVWMDHRAIEEARQINQTQDGVLKYVGGVISPEMEIPKILWLKKNLPQQHRKVAKYMDLADFMVYRASGKDIRSVCTLVCKWTYLAHEQRWSQNLFRTLELDDLFEGGRLGNAIEPLGENVGSLTPQAARELGLTTDAAVAVGVIDAHAGGIGMIGKSLQSSLAIIGGTSSCHMAVSQDPIFVGGVWGPYFGAMVPGMWLNEGGQSATGALVDHIIEDSAVYPRLRQAAESAGCSTYELLNQRIFELEQQTSHLTANYHVLGYHHGNRSPRANPQLTGMISGLTLHQSEAELAKKYLAAIGSVAYGTRHIIETMNACGHNIEKIFMCGGGTKNPLWLREHADITGCQIQLPGEPEAVLLGSAMMAASAAGLYSSLQDAMREMSTEGQVIMPRREFAVYHQQKYRVFKELYEDQVKYAAMMKEYA